MAFTKTKREEIHRKYNGRCAYCGERIEIKRMQVDHIIPQREFAYDVNRQFKVPSFLTHLTENDVNHDDNLNPACAVCNKWKCASSLEFFRFQIEDQLNQLNSHSSSYRMASRYGLVDETPHPIVFYFETLTK
jgi:hypothetical protein